LLENPIAPAQPVTVELPAVTPPAEIDFDVDVTTIQTAEQRHAALAKLAAEVAHCTKCGLCKTRKQTVFSDGDPCAEVCFVGEAPGADEDRTGVPFVGRAGQLLTDIIEKGMKIPRSTVYICNVLKCRPPDNRDPNPDEVHQCEPYLKHQLKIVRPKVIVALGRHAAHTLLKTSESTGKLRGKWHAYEGIPLRVTYHPSYLLRSPAEKVKTWEDIKEVMKFLDQASAGGA
jgi:DNA polymerase